MRGGANLAPAQKERFRAINAELSALGIKFGDNLLHDTNAYRLVIENEADLKGLPPSVVAAGAEAAKAAGLPGKWVYTLQAPSIWPFLQYADNRELRRQILTAYTTRNDHGDQYDNKAIVAQQAALRAERAQLLGYKTHADYVLEENMAKTPDKVYDLLNQLWTPARAMALREAADQQALIKASGGAFTLEAWDWRYYQEKVKQQRFDLDEQALRPYFKLDNVRQGAFYVANRLYGLTFTPRPDLPVYHPEVQAFEVKDADGSHLGVYYTDYHPRPGKRVGRVEQHLPQHAHEGRRAGHAGRRQRLQLLAAGRRRAGAADASRRSSTLFHEFGHALNSLLSKSPYRGPRRVPARLRRGAVADHGELGARARGAEGLREALQDGRGHPAGARREDQEGRAVRPGLHHRRVPGRVVPRHGLAHADAGAGAGHDGVREGVAGEDPAAARHRARATAAPYFNHIFGPGGGYASGYYAYIWSEVLDQDAFEAFREKGLFDQATARGFRTILEKGGTDGPDGPLQGVPRARAERRAAAQEARAEVANGRAGGASPPLIRSSNSSHSHSFHHSSSSPRHETPKAGHMMQPSPRIMSSRIRWRVSAEQGLAGGSRRRSSAWSIARDGRSITPFRRSLGSHSGNSTEFSASM